MEEGLRWKAGGKRASSKHESPSSSRLMYERRPLKSVPLAPPDYTIQSHILVESYLEKEVRFLGIVSHITADLDATNRTEVLRHIDRGKREEKVACIATRDHDAIFSLCIHNVKISCRDGKEEVHIRLPIHKIGAVCYIRDDEQHLFCIKFGDITIGNGGAVEESRDKMCQLAVLSCDSQRIAEELCSVVSQTFQLVYTEATLQYLDKSLREPDISVDTSTIRSERSATSTPGLKHAHKSPRNFQFLSRSSLDLDQPALPSESRRSSMAQSDSDMSTSAQEQLKEYVCKKLYTKLTSEELQIFASLINKWKSTMPFEEFCEKILDLFGPPRKHLLIDMRPFIPELDRSYFDAFLERIGVRCHPSLHELSNVPTVLWQGGPVPYPEQGTSLLSDTLTGSRLSLALQEASQTGSRVNLSLDTHVPKT